MHSGTLHGGVAYSTTSFCRNCCMHMQPLARMLGGLGELLGGS